jgi:hypothetical protein
VIVPAWVLVVLVLGATARLCRLVTADYITKPVRDRIKTRFGDNRLHYFVTCDWCTSFWIAPVLATGAVLWPTNRVILIVLLALTASLFAGLSPRLEG